jgi:glycosyltransferase involved in cell wall biosynthesis
MRLFARLRSWLKWIVKRTLLETAMEAEVRFHIESYAEDVEDGVTGTVVPESGATSLAQAVVAILKDNDFRRREKILTSLESASTTNYST